MDGWVGGMFAQRDSPTLAMERKTGGGGEKGERERETQWLYLREKRPCSRVRDFLLLSEQKRGEEEKEAKRRRPKLFESSDAKL